MEQERVAQIFADIGEAEGDKALKAAKELINSSNDSDLRADVMKLMTEFMGAKNPSEQDVVQNKIIQYIKSQMALLYVQAFRGGRSHQMMLQNQQTQRLIEMASRMDNRGTVNEQEFTLPEGCPMTVISNHEELDNLDGTYHGVTEGGEKVKFRPHPGQQVEVKEGEFMEVDWELVSVDKEKLAEFMKEQGLIPEDGASE